MKTDVKNWKSVLFWTEWSYPKIEIIEQSKNRISNSESEILSLVRKEKTYFLKPVKTRKYMRMSNSESEELAHYGKEKTYFLVR